MANESVTIDPRAATADKARRSTADVGTGLTRATEFNDVPVADMRLMTVREGVDCFYAMSQAGALDSAVQAMLQQSVQGGMDGDLAYLCEFALDAAAALRTAAGRGF